MKFKGIILTILLLTGICILSIKVCQLELKKRAIKKDLIELSNIKYGLFSIDDWKEILANIITKKIKEFNLDDANKEALRQEITKLLTQQIDILEHRFKEKQSQSIIGLLQGTVVEFTGIFDQIKKDIPYYTRGIIDFVNDPRTKVDLRAYVLKKLND